MSFCACGIDLFTRGSVCRRYEGVGGAAVGIGHYDVDGCFEPDAPVDLPESAQTLDGFDTCEACGAIVG
jgi:hypothetical protein